jgi:hypothetical protein
MKIKELFEDTNTKPHVYLDMDGVQADFATAVTEKIGMDHEEAKHKSEEEIEKLANSSHTEVRDFFANLKQLSGGKKITDWLNKNSIPYTILSAPLRGKYEQASIEGKVLWLKKHTPNAASNAIFKQEKHEHAVEKGVPNILIDDYGVKIKAWNQAGGIGIKHEDEYETPDAAERTINRLEEIFFNEENTNE